MIECTKCGICCMNLHHNPTYAALDRGDGICRNFDREENLCTIYENRPDICNSEKMYQQFFQHKMSKEHFVLENKNYCESAKYNQLLTKPLIFYRA